MKLERISLSLTTCALVALTATTASEITAQGAVDRNVTASAADDAPASTYYGGVDEALRRNCVSCHRADAPSIGGITAPMSFTSYEDARRWASRIARVVSEGYMPPWGADAQHEGVFKDERYLSNEDKQTLVAWADAGAPMGDPSEATEVASMAEVVTGEPTRAPDGSMWWMGVPDMIVGFQEPVLVCDAVEDWQPRLPMRVIDGQIDEPKWIRAMEISPGSEIVHHTVSSHLGVGVPGRGPFEFPEGWGILLTEDPQVSISMHYHKDPGPGTAVYDDTRGGFAFYEEGDVIDHVVETRLQPFTDFTIPPGDPNYEVRNVTNIDEDIYLLSMGPHAHYRGKAVKIELERPDRSFRETLLWVPDYDFNWQFQYELKEPYFIPAGSRMHITWWYDNSTANPFNPDPTAEVTYGPATTDEMMNARIYFARAEPLGLRVGGPIPADILERADEASERERRNQVEWEEATRGCGVQGVASR
jgi:mono/diheme cytochrome c family protein